jgi:exodeoxyribonuclease VII small subunit
MGKPNLDKKEESGPSFEESLVLLERIVQELESGELPLDRAIQQYQAGMELVRACRDRLRAAEQQIEAVAALEREVSVRPFVLEEGPPGGD